MPAKQVIVVRKDLNMRKGKMVAQGSHAAMKDLIRKWRALREQVVTMGTDAKTIDDMGRAYFQLIRELPVLTPAEQEWYYGNFRKICLYVPDEASLVALHEAALARGLVSHMVEDHGLTEFHGVLTKTCIAIGPCYDEDVDPLTGHLPLM